MKRLIYLTYLGLLALILISCEKETIVPENAVAANPTEQARFSSCRPYSYYNKIDGIKHLGNIRTDYVLVGFADNVTAAQQQNLLSQYQIFDQLDGDVFFDSGLITIVKLKSNATCTLVEAMLDNLEKKTQVRFAAPVFNDPAGVLDWLGQTNEIIVTLKRAAYYQQFENMVNLTKCTIVTNLDDSTYIVSADKKATVDALQMTTVFNVSSFVFAADPNFLMQQMPVNGNAVKPIRKQYREKLNVNASL